jgi:glutamine synthetase
VRVEVRPVAPDSDPYAAPCSRREPTKRWPQIKNLQQAERYLPDNRYAALEGFKEFEWIAKIFGQDLRSRYAELKQASDRCSCLLGTFLEPPEA